MVYKAILDSPFLSFLSVSRFSVFFSILDTGYVRQIELANSLVNFLHTLSISVLILFYSNFFVFFSALYVGICLPVGRINTSITEKNIEPL